MPHDPPCPGLAGVVTQCRDHAGTMQRPCRDHAETMLSTAQSPGALPLCCARISIRLHPQPGQRLVSLSCKPEKGCCALNIPGILQKSTLFICPPSQAAFQAKAHDSSNGADHPSLGKDTHSALTDAHTGFTKM